MDSEQDLLQQAVNTVIARHAAISPPGGGLPETYSATVNPNGSVRFRQGPSSPHPNMGILREEQERLQLETEMEVRRLQVARPATQEQQQAAESGWRQQAIVSGQAHQMGPSGRYVPVTDPNTEGDLFRQRVSPTGARSWDVMLPPGQEEPSADGGTGTGPGGGPTGGGRRPGGSGAGILGGLAAGGLGGAIMGRVATGAALGGVAAATTGGLSSGLTQPLHQLMGQALQSGGGTGAGIQQIATGITTTLATATTMAARTGGAVLGGAMGLLLGSAVGGAVGMLAGTLLGGLGVIGGEVGRMAAATIGGIATAARDAIKETLGLAEAMVRLATTTGMGENAAMRLITGMKALGFSEQETQGMFGGLDRQFWMTEMRLNALGVAVVRNKDGGADYLRTLLNVSAELQKYPQYMQPMMAKAMGVPEQMYPMMQNPNMLRQAIGEQDRHTEDAAGLKASWEALKVPLNDISFLWQHIKVAAVEAFSPMILQGLAVAQNLWQQHGQQVIGWLREAPGHAMEGLVRIGRWFDETWATWRPRLATFWDGFVDGLNSALRVANSILSVIGTLTGQKFPTLPQIGGEGGLRPAGYDAAGHPFAEAGRTGANIVQRGAQFAEDHPTATRVVAGGVLANLVTGGLLGRGLIAGGGAALRGLRGASAAAGGAEAAVEGASGWARAGSWLRGARGTQFAGIPGVDAAESAARDLGRARGTDLARRMGYNVAGAGEEEATTALRGIRAARFGGAMRLAGGVAGGLEIGAIGSSLADRRPWWQQSLAGFGSVWAGAGAGALGGGPIGALGGAVGALAGGIGSPLLELWRARREGGRVDAEVAAGRSAGLAGLRDADGLTPRQRILRDQQAQRQAEGTRQPGTFEQFFRDMQAGMQRAQLAQNERYLAAQQPQKIEVAIKTDPTRYFATQIAAQMAGEGLFKLIGATVG